MNKSFFLITAFCLSLLFSFSCKTKEVVSHKTNITPNADGIVNLMKKKQFDFTTLSLKFNAEVQTEEESNSFSGNIYMVKDSTIWISVQKLGMEAFRFLITADSVKMLDRINKVFIAGDYVVLNKMLKTNFDFDQLQALITGNDAENYDTAGFAIEYEKNDIILSDKNRKKISGGITSDMNDQQLWINSDNYKIIKNIIKETYGQTIRSFECTYSDFQNFDGQKFPQKIDFQFSDTKTTKGSINFTRISPEKKETFSFTVPASYTRKL
jgi:hypothetical protein